MSEQEFEPVAQDVPKSELPYQELLKSSLGQLPTQVPQELLDLAAASED